MLVNRRRRCLYHSYHLSWLVSLGWVCSTATAEPQDERHAEAELLMSSVFSFSLEGSTILESSDAAYTFSLG
jgi:hypothetical protein